MTTKEVEQIRETIALLDNLMESIPSQEIADASNALEVLLEGKE